MPDVSPGDRDMMIRTVIGEADDQPAIGQAAVAHVILNRLAAGRYGTTPSDVVLAKGQFEPWQTRARELSSIRTDSPRYRKVAGIVDDVLAGRTPDPTGGMTHFLEPDIVRRRYGALPDWASGPGLRIGGHVFYAPEGQVSASQASSTDPMDAITAAVGATPTWSMAPGGSTPGAASGADMFEDAGFRASAGRSAPAPSGDMFEAAGFRTSTGKPGSPLPQTLGPDAPPGAVGYVEVPGGGKHYIDGNGSFIQTTDMNPKPPSWGEQFLRRSSSATGHGEEIKHEVANAFLSSNELAKRGWQDITSGYPIVAGPDGWRAALACWPPPSRAL